MNKWRRINQDAPSNPCCRWANDLSQQWCWDWRFCTCLSRWGARLIKIYICELPTDPIRTVHRNYINSIYTFGRCCSYTLIGRFVDSFGKSCFELDFFCAFLSHLLISLLRVSYQALTEENKNRMILWRFKYLWFVVILLTCHFFMIL